MVPFKHVGALCLPIVSKWPLACVHRPLWYRFHAQNMRTYCGTSALILLHGAALRTRSVPSCSTATASPSAAPVWVSCSR
jgi:hypothetical protein